MKIGNICDDAWMLVSKYCDSVSLLLLSNSNKRISGLTQEEQKTRKWSDEDLLELSSCNQFTMVTKMIKERWIDEYEIDDAYNKAVKSANFKAIIMILKNSFHDLGILQIIIFTRHYIFVRNIELIHNSQLIQMFLKIETMPLHSISRLFILVCGCANKEIVNLLLKDPRVDVNCEKNEAIKSAIRNHKNEIVQLLLDTGKIQKHFDKDLFCFAVCAENFPAFKMLLAHKDFDPVSCNLFEETVLKHEFFECLMYDNRMPPNYKNSLAVIYTCENGNVELLEYLLKHESFNLSVHGNEAFRKACGNGHLDCVRILLRYPQVDPSHFNNKSITWAYYQYDNKWKIIKLLMSHPKVNPFNRKLPSIEEFRKMDPSVYFKSLLI